MTTFGPPSFNWDGGVNLLFQKNAHVDFYRLTSVDAGSVGAGITVTSAQNSQVTGYQIAASTSWFSNIASGGAAVLPETSAPNLLTGLAGLFLTILNTSVTPLSVYPSPADTSNGINGGAVNAPVIVSPGVYAIFHCFQPGFWVTAGPTGGGGAVLSVFGRTGTVVANSGDYSFAQISGSLPNSQLASMPANTIKGNNTAGSAAPLDLTATQATAMLNLFTSGLQGLVPPSGGGTGNFLRADGAWASPPGGGGGGGGGTPGGANTDVQFNSLNSFAGDGGFTYAGSGSVSISQGTLTTDRRALSITGTWNNGGLNFIPFQMNYTNTASNSPIMMDLQVAGVSFFQVVPPVGFQNAGINFIQQSAGGVFNFISGGALANGNNAPNLVFQTSRGTSASPTSVNTGDVVSEILSAPFDGSQNQFNASVDFVVDGLAGGVASAISLKTGATSRTERLRVDSLGNVQVTGGTLGYGTGVGGTVTQATSRTTGVTLNKICGAITLVSAAGSATPATFTVTNSTVAQTDTIIVNQKSGTDKYEIFVTNVTAGAFTITSFTTGGTTTEQPVFNFAVIKAVTS